MNKLKENEIIVHFFRMGDVDDPEIYAGEPLYKWQQTDHGKWVMKHALQPPTYHIIPDLLYAGYKIVVSAELSPKDQTFYRLKWPENIS